jgi:hypothetical protein
LIFSFIPIDKRKRELMRVCDMWNHVLNTDPLCFAHDKHVCLSTNPAAAGEWDRNFVGPRASWSRIEKLTLHIRDEDVFPIPWPLKTSPIEDVIRAMPWTFPRLRGRNITLCGARSSTVFFIV